MRGFAAGTLGLLLGVTAMGLFFTTIELRESNSTREKARQHTDIMADARAMREQTRQRQKELVRAQLSRDERPLPSLHLTPGIKDITMFTMEDIKLVGYDPHGPIQTEMAV